MNPENPLWKQHRKSLIGQLENLKSLIDNLKQNYSLSNIIALKRDAHRMADSAKVFGYKEAFEWCQKLEWEMIAKEKNYNLEAYTPEWGVQWSEFFGKIEKGFLIKDLNDMEQSLAASGKQKKSIVVVDDDGDIVKLLDYEFKELGFDVVSFQNGNGAQSYLLNPENMKNTNLLILDRILPDMDGLDILTKISKEFPNHCPVLILSALGSENDIISGLQGGAIDYVTKPFSIFLLLQKALNLLKS